MINLLRAFTRDDSTRIWEHLNEIQQKLNEVINRGNNPSPIDLAKAGLVAPANVGVIFGTTPPEGTLLTSQYFARSVKTVLVHSTLTKAVVNFPAPFANGIVYYNAWVADGTGTQIENRTAGLTAIELNTRTREMGVLPAGVSVTIAMQVVGW